jgi:hypothetical protein
MPGVELQSHEKHVKPHAELRPGIQDAARLRRENQIGRFRPDISEQRRPDQHPGDHFPHHLRLADLFRHPAYEPAGEQDHRHLEKKMCCENLHGAHD